MRVSKTVKDYIAKEVRTRVYKKYAGEKEIKEERENFLDKVIDTAEQQAFETYIKTVKDMIKDCDYIEIVDDIEKRFYISGGYNNVRIKDREYIDNVYNWKSRANTEVKEKVEEIIVTLELGGNKEDLDRMLKEI